MILEATITCPVCGTHHLEQMPTDACQVCVFCSYADAPCPPKQARENT